MRHTNADTYTNHGHKHTYTHVHTRTHDTQHTYTQTAHNTQVPTEPHLNTKITPHSGDTHGSTKKHTAHTQIQQRKQTNKSWKHTHNHTTRGNTAIMETHRNGYKDARKIPWLQQTDWHAVIRSKTHTYTRTHSLQSYKYRSLRSHSQPRYLKNIITKTTETTRSRFSSPR